MTAHKILIAAAILLSLIFGIRAAFNYASMHANSDLIATLAGVGLALSFGLYLRALWRR